ncbi:ABC transporter ATP-binding protein [Streptomyces johnsoniae]|uniref:ABC transporter ATP-binding protein n=1 Tax=Streptomyces johnsoniae TaxID=3075532 RepID=A0ABU2S2T5_9ACTN|nr:ABC transporter ATP-binding protein [Streptomyces sp. DSM 41886]MDT0443011.1 ABC transporter ATP-binding protein [Streptomyces sp. DSM 41886]
MIRTLLSLGDRPGARPIRTNLISLVIESVLAGTGYACMVPASERVLSDRPQDAWPWIIAVAVLFACYAVVRYRAQLAAYRAAVGLARQLFRRLGDKVAALPLGWFSDPRRVGELSQLSSRGIVDVMGVPAHLLRPVVASVVTPATLLAALFVFEWRLALVALAGLPLVAVVGRWAGRLVARLDRVQKTAATAAAGRVVEFAQAQATLRAAGRTASGHRLLEEALAEQSAAQRSTTVIAAPALLSTNLVIQLLLVALLAAGAQLALGGELGTAELVALLVLGVRLVEPLMTAVENGAALRMAGNAMARYQEILATAELPAPEATPAGEGPAEPSVELRGVTFGYGGEPVLRDVSLVARPGTMTALVGPSGSGKTTVLRLIARFWDVDEGSVSIGGRDVRELATEELMRHIALVFQDVYLFDGPIEENIRMSRPEASDEELRRAAELARVTEVVDRLPDGWRTRVGEGGAALSGGERQRISIARALLKDAPIVLLDEATAALDAANDAAVAAALASLRTDRTLIVVAHRLPTVRSADRILVLDGGRVAEEGDHEQLLQHGGRYRTFWEERTRSVGWRLTSPTPSE